MLGITMGDSSGIGPEVLLKAFGNGEIRQRVVVYGDMAVLELYNGLLAFGVPLRAVRTPLDCRSGFLNVIDSGILKYSDVTFGKLNTDENTGVTMKFQIMSIPTLLFFKNGEMVDRIVGVVPKEQIESVVRKHL